MHSKFYQWQRRRLDVLMMDIMVRELRKHLLM